MAIYHTQGLPDGSHKETLYEFNITQNHSAGETVQSYIVFIPGNYVGRDQTGDPTYIEQVHWLNSIAPKYNIKEVWYGTWEIIGENDYHEIIRLLTSCQ